MERRFTHSVEFFARMARKPCSDGSVWPRSEEAMYVGIVQAWCRLGPAAERRRHPLGPFVLGPDFVWLVRHTPVDGLTVATACAKAASRFPWKPGKDEPQPQAGPPEPGPKPLLSWWYPLSANHSLGLHYCESASGIIEFLLVGRQEEGATGRGLARG